MTGLHMNYCPRCELRFTSSSEMKQHLRDAHQPPPSTMKRDPVTASAPMFAPQLHQHHQTAGDSDAPSRRRASKWTVALGGLGPLIVILVAWIAPVATAAITATLIAALIGCYWWRLQTRAWAPDHGRPQAELNSPR